MSFFWGEKKRVLAIVILPIIVSQIWEENGLCRVILIVVLLSWRIMVEPFKLSSFFLCRKEDLKPTCTCEVSRRLNPLQKGLSMAHRARPVTMTVTAPGESLPGEWMQGMNGCIFQPSHRFGP